MASDEDVPAALYQTVLDSAGSAVAALDSSGRLLVYNPAAHEILGTLSELPLGRIVKGSEQLDGEVRYIRHPRTGEGMWLRLTSRPLGEDGGAVLVFEDITTSERARARARAVMRASIDGIALLNHRGEVIERNAAMKGLLQQGDVPFDRIEVDGQRLVSLLGAEAVGPLEGNAGPIPVEVTVVPIDDGDKPTYAVTVRDIRSRKELEDQRSAFLSMVSHELRTPLTSVLGSIALARSGKLPPERMGILLDTALRNSNRLLRLVNDLLDLQKMASGRLTIDPNDVDLTHVVAEAVQANVGYADPLDVALKLVSPDEPVFVRGDHDRLLQVLANLVSNAVKHSPAGQRVLVKLVVSNGRARVSVADRGNGIPADLRERIFEPFAADDSGARRSGTGLGLPIARAIVELHGGTMDFKSVTGKGTSFFFDLATTEPKDQAE